MGAKVLPAGTGGDADVFALFAMAEARAFEAPQPSAEAADPSGAPPGCPKDEAERIKAWATKNKSVLTAKAAGDDLELAILGVIGSWWDAITARAVRSVLNDHKDAKTIRVLIDSPGGDYFEGVAIMNLLRRHKARVTIEVIGEATSAGSVIAMAGDRIEMHVGTMMMIHRAWTFAVGNGGELRSAAEMLDKVDEGLVAVYKARTGANEKDIRKWVDATTWMSSADAVERGFADAELAALPPKSDPKESETAGGDELPVPDAKSAQAPSAASAHDPLPRAAASRMPSVANRSAAPAAADPTSGGNAAGEPTTPAPAAAVQQPAAHGQEKTPMTVSKTDPENTVITPAIVRACGLAAGSTEQDVLAAVTRMRELELGVMTLTGVTNSAEALGAVRGLKAVADSSSKVAAELTDVKGERDKQNFDALIMKGTSAPVKLSGATAKLYQDRFDEAVKADNEAKDGQGRAERVVKDLQGFLAVAPTIIGNAARPPETKGEKGPTGNIGSGALTYNGKAFADMKGMERSRLSREEPELYAAMRQDWLDAGSPPPAAKSA